MELLTSFNGMLYLSAYLIGGIPFGYLLAKYVGGVNVKEAGSKNIGATNVLRVLKQKDEKLAKKLGALTLFLDAIKGVIVLLVAKYLGASEFTLWSVAVFAVLGHCYSPYLKFEGGKGVATAFGVLLFLIPIPTLIALLAWAISAKVLKISSLSSLIALAVLLISAKIIYPDGLPGIYSFAPLYLIAFIIFYKHIPNIKRLLSKEEGRVV
ncbi:MAG: glycerol-3-phosphate 1-O-acyltransferase PlsY [Epsilonproteobacteria bacterium]|nr:glycerol-3-phosphate 1-O-acyltransferase PlsY [Campylobacterota bacterium]